SSRLRFWARSTSARTTMEMRSFRLLVQEACGPARASTGRHSGSRGHTGSAIRPKPVRTKGIARREVGSTDQQLQRCDSRKRKERADGAELRWLRGQLLHCAVYGVVARFLETCGLSRANGLPSEDSVRRVFADRPASTEVFVDGLRQAG